MSRIAILFLDLLILYFFFGHAFLRRFYPRPSRLRAELRDIEKHYAHLVRKDCDILPAQSLESLQAAVAELRRTREGDDAEAAAACLERYRTASPVVLPARSHPWVRDNLEVLVVALGLAFGVRALFLQPFKIPTGSMQPTLYGVHFQPSLEPVRANPVQRFLGYVNYTRRYVDVTVAEDGYLDLFGVQRVRPAIPFFPSSLVAVGSRTYRLPGAPGDVQKYLESLHGRGAYLRAGDTLARGALSLGDHLFVDRTHLAFSEPRRGDVMVFVTDGITREGGAPLAGRFYIKRLVGLPGDTLRIADGRLYVREAGASGFRPVDGEDAPGFRRIYSMKGGYHGYTNHSHAPFLNDAAATYTIPADHFFMLGDNSGFSLDSRFWRTVPRRNLVGRALWVWWPFSRRWGGVDRLEPENGPPMLHPRRDPDSPPLLE